MKLALRIKRRLGILLLGGERRSMKIAERVHAHLAEVDEAEFVRNPHAVLDRLEAVAKKELKS